ncbi:endonuclease III domain-containing protein [uncultured Desulfuromonas sp.]|uniref:endonuclease III domain-containing protein n=1 Tax=uncultured Desulfuromonas sp. TaxID=181013 RepID=UPI002AAA74D9|nr:endonuclease III domain-containing protein [uncultured Desulfuromonas sp.]
MVRPTLTVVFELLLERFGPQFWWPAEDTFEMMVGAVLTQNTAWRNVELSIAVLKEARVLTPKALHRISEVKLQELIRSSGFFQRKSQCLKNLAAVICRDYQGAAASFLDGDLHTVRQRLLAQPGIGPETADCMVLYGAGLPIFVVDAYTRRIFSRLGLLDAKARYDMIQRYAMQHLPADTSLFNEFHALLVELGKVCCRSRNPRCEACPLNQHCRSAFSL